MAWNTKKLLHEVSTTVLTNMYILRFNKMSFISFHFMLHMMTMIKIKKLM